MHNKKLLTILFLAVFFCCFAAVDTLFADLKGMTKDDWQRVLSEINISPDSAKLEKLAKSVNTLDKINRQTKGNLKIENWIEIFKKLNIVPKSDMQTSQWDALFSSVGIKYKIVEAQPPKKELPAPSSEERAAKEEEAERGIVVTEPAPEAEPEPEAPKPGVDEAKEAKDEIKPKKTAKKAKKFPKISLDLKGMDILSTLKIISKKSGLNIIAGRNVKGKVTIYLNNVDAYEALKMILEMNNLAYIEEENVIKVLTSQNYEKIYGKKFYDKTTVDVINLKFAKADNVSKTLTVVKSKVGQIVADSGTNSLIIIDTPESIERLKKLVESLDVKTETKVFALNYAKPKDVSEKLKTVVSPNIGEIQVDERNNQVIVKDRSDKIGEISKLIISLDKQHQEVLIEAKIVQIILNKDLKMGINWEYIFDKVNDQPVNGTAVSNVVSIPTINLTPTAEDNESGGSSGSSGSTGLQLRVNTLARDKFTAVLDLLQKNGETNLVSSPRITTLENVEASIHVGTKEKFVTTTVTRNASGQETRSENVVEEKVGIKLLVTPTIGDDGYVTMKISPEVSSVEDRITTSEGNEIPIVRTSKSETTVMVKDGVTIVIAGLIEEKDIKKFNGIPLLCRIPILGTPFRRTITEKAKTELAVFLTPHIISGDKSTEELTEKPDDTPDKKIPAKKKAKNKEK